LNLPDVEDDRSLFDFLYAISSVAPEFANPWRINIQATQSKGEALPSLYKMIEYFRNDRRILNAQKGASHGAFGASYQGKPLDGNADESKSNSNTKPSGNDRKPKHCLCGKEHPFKDCYYLVESIRPKDWKPDPAIQKQVEEKAKEGSPRMKAAIRWARKNAAKE
jgi:hypothetical protein